YSSRDGGRQQPDTLVVRGLPSRWFAEPRVSSKPSMLVTHTIFSVFGKIRQGLKLSRLTIKGHGISYRSSYRLGYNTLSHK
ncbi:A-kinase anchor protein 17a-like, partial [Thalictrum thalictroides]